MTSKTLDIIHKDFSEFSELLNNKSKWLQPDYLDKQYVHYSQPHTQEYFNPFGAPLFLVTIKKLEWLNMFPLVFVRDGITSIAHFFFTHPVPDKVTAILAIPKEAESVIPEPWVEHCLIYEIKRFINNEEKSRSSLSFVSTISEHLYDLSLLKKDLINIRNKYPLEMNAIIFDNIRLGEEEREHYNLHNAKFYNLLYEVFDGKLPLSNWASSRSLDYSSSYFFETHQNSLNFSDSYVTHQFLSQGAIPLCGKYQEEEFGENCKRVSRYHFFKFSSAELKKESTILWKKILDIKDLVLRDEKLINRTIKDFEHIRLCTPEFESLIRRFINDHKTL